MNHVTTDGHVHIRTYVYIICNRAVQYIRTYVHICNRAVQIDKPQEMTIRHQGCCMVVTR